VVAATAAKAVSRSQAEMDDALLVRGLHRVGDLRCDLQRFLVSAPEARRSASVGPMPDCSVSGTSFEGAKSIEPN